MPHERTREIRLRRMAARQGLALHKSRRRDPLALGYGRWMLTSSDGQVAAGADGEGRPAWTLEQIEAHLTTGGES